MKSDIIKSNFHSYYALLFLINRFQAFLDLFLQIPTVIQVFLCFCTLKLR